MSLLKYINNDSYIYQDSDSIIAIGNFDGFHIGHRALIESMNKIKLDKSAKSLVFSFCPRPTDVFRNITSKSIFSLNERIEIAERLGVDILVEYPFSLEFSYMSGEDFIKNILAKQFRCKHIVIGADFVFGKDRMWDAKWLSEVGEKFEIGVTVLSHECVGNEKISSSVIRAHLEKGEVGAANKLLGHEYFLSGIIKHGNKRGRDLGFPTMNIEPGADKILPKNGVYITKTHLQDGSSYPSITNIGNNITFEYVTTRAETYIHGFNGSIYEQEAKVVFKEHVRGEVKFSGEAELIKQIGIDLDKMKAYYGGLV